MWTHFLIPVALAITGAAAASAHHRPSRHQSWDVATFKNLITFGDSYTDESRLAYFINSGGKAPPTGTYLPESFSTADGGRIWARYVVQYTGKNENQKWMPSMTLYDYAVSGAVVSNLETPRYLPIIKAPFPDIELYEVPAYLADKKFINTTTGASYFRPAVSNQNTVATMFIGTNDIGVYAYFTDSQIPGNTLVSYLDKVYDQLDKIYASGVRYFVLFNLFPLYLAPLYANSSYGGSAPTQYWPDRPTNLTATSLKMQEYVDTVNEAYRVRTPFEVIIQKRYPGAHFANFDVNSWALNIYSNPSQYYNGTLAPNVTGTVHSCADAQCSSFITSNSPDSFFWYDSLHPSEQTWRHLASEVVSVLNGTSGYAKYYHDGCLDF